MAVRILIADDHAVFRSGLRLLLEREADLQVVAEAGDGFETLRKIAEEPIDLLILDLAMPGLPGIKVAEVVRKEHSKVAIVVLTMHDNDYYLRQMLRLGVRAFVLKQSAGTNLLDAIRAARRGKQYVDPALTEHLVPSYIGKDPSPQPGALAKLTVREREVCQLLALGHTSKEIADHLLISERTAETHRANIMEKLNLKSRAELVRFAIENRLLRMD